MHGRVFQTMQAIVLTGFCLAGCSDAPAPPSEAPFVNAQLAAHFDKDATGTIVGQVLWDGAAPEIPPLLMRTDPPVAPGKSCPNPNGPIIEPRSKGVGNAVVFLRHVDPQKARPWDHAKVRVELNDLAIHVVQASTRSRLGIVRRGDLIETVSREPVFHALEARGAAFFSLRFVDKDKPTMRPLQEKGVVELQSAAGYFWMHAHLFVDDHPYYARTDATGRFELPRVPEGKYQIVCWMPNWHVVRKERDPESSLTRRLAFAAPLERTAHVDVEPHAASAVHFHIATGDFAKN
jgi:hypothetical protein